LNIAVTWQQQQPAWNLVAIEIALATVLLIAAGLLLRTFAFLAWIRNGQPIDH
jgi:hypothetical protein